jgi:hypothetical protein
MMNIENTEMISTLEPMLMLMKQEITSSFNTFKDMNTTLEVTPIHHFIFCSNDHHRKFGDDFDVRTHNAGNEERNIWIIEHAGGNHYTIRSKTNPNHYLFAAHDGANKYGDDYDVRTHPHVVIHSF